MTAFGGSLGQLLLLAHAARRIPVALLLLTPGGRFIRSGRRPMGEPERIASGAAAPASSGIIAGEPHQMPDGVQPEQDRQHALHKAVPAELASRL